mmetsp:Transcript_35496/g.110732  ORF Transcript_35496/g.110732 Transcript_35496/m.110732 type:complete len:206 (+) Transcript_35496:18-635(+)
MATPRAAPPSRRPSLSSRPSCCVAGTGSPRSSDPRATPWGCSTRGSGRSSTWRCLSGRRGYTSPSQTNTPSLGRTGRARASAASRPWSRPGTLASMITRRTTPWPTSRSASGIASIPITTAATSRPRRASSCSSGGTCETRSSPSASPRRMATSIPAQGRGSRRRCRRASGRSFHGWRSGRATGSCGSARSDSRGLSSTSATRGS